MSSLDAAIQASLATRNFRRAAIGARGVRTERGYVVFLRMDGTTRAGNPFCGELPLIVAEGLWPTPAVAFLDERGFHSTSRLRLMEFFVAWRHRCPWLTIEKLQKMEDLAYPVIYGDHGPEWAA